MSQVRQNVDRRGKCETHSLKMWIRVASLHSDARLTIALQSPQNALQSHFRVSLQLREENSARAEFCCQESRILSFWQNVKGQNVRSKLNSSRVHCLTRCFTHCLTSLPHFTASPHCLAHGLSLGISHGLAHGLTHRLLSNGYSWHGKRWPRQPVWMNCSAATQRCQALGW